MTEVADTHEAPQRAGQSHIVSTLAERIVAHEAQQFPRQRHITETQAEVLFTGLKLKSSLMPGSSKRCLPGTQRHHNLRIYIYIFEEDARSMPSLLLRGWVQGVVREDQLAPT